MGPNITPSLIGEEREMILMTMKSCYDFEGVC
jgi:hypothetical protein